MTKFEKRLFLIVSGVAVVFSIVIVWGLMRHVLRGNDADHLLVVEVQTSTSEKATPLEESQRDKVMSTFKIRIAPVEVGPAHRAMKTFCEQTFVKDVHYSFTTFENLLRPELEDYFAKWHKEIALDTLKMLDLEGNQELLDEMLLFGNHEEKIHFMLLYERVSLINSGILIDTY